MIPLARLSQFLKYANQQDEIGKITKRKFCGVIMSSCCFSLLIKQKYRGPYRAFDYSAADSFFKKKNNTFYCMESIGRWPHYSYDYTIVLVLLSPSSRSTKERGVCRCSSNEWRSGIATKQWNGVAYRGSQPRRKRNFTGTSPLRFTAKLLQPKFQLPRPETR